MDTSKLASKVPNGLYTCHHFPKICLNVQSMLHSNPFTIVRSTVLAVLPKWKPNQSQQWSATSVMCVWQANRAVHLKTMQEQPASISQRETMPTCKRLIATAPSKAWWFWRNQQLLCARAFWARSHRWVNPISPPAELEKIMPMP